jgi:predicted DNA-binding transcriptional regulator AlpA
LRCAIPRIRQEVTKLLDQLLSDREVAMLTGRARSSLQKDRSYGGGIPFIRLGRLIRYRSSDVDAYIAALPSFRSTSELTTTRPRGR